jgi:hypothetical protein
MMSTRKQLTPRIASSSLPVSVEAILRDLNLERPILLSELFAFLAPIHLTFMLSAGACSGSCELLMGSDGGVQFAGHVHNSGAVPVGYTVITSLARSGPDGGPVILVEHKGQVGGTFSFGSRDDDWAQSVVDPKTAANWSLIRAAESTGTTVFGTSLGGFDAIDALVASATGAWILHL